MLKSVLFLLGSGIYKTYNIQWNASRIYGSLLPFFSLFALATGWLSNAFLPSTEWLPTAADTTPSLHA